MREPVAYKVLTEEELEALRRDAFTGSAVDKADGYIHLSTAAQVSETVTRHFAGQANLAIAAVAVAVLGANVRWEPSRRSQLFPHLYGRLPLAAVLAFGPLEFDETGAVKLPPL